MSEERVWLCGHLHRTFEPGCLYCAEILEDRVELERIAAMCPQHNPGFDQDCGACGERQDVAVQWFLASVQRAVDGIGLADE